MTWHNPGYHWKQGSKVTLQTFQTSDSDISVIFYSCWNVIQKWMHDLYGRNVYLMAWWRHSMETFSELLAICAGKSPVTDDFPTQRSVTQSFDVFFGLRLNKWLSKQWWGWWFGTLSRPFWRHCNGHVQFVATALLLAHQLHYLIYLKWQQWPCRYSMYELCMIRLQTNPINTISPNEPY